MLFGEKDKLVPSGVAQSIADLNPEVDVRTIAGAGHAPFLTHPTTFLAAVKPFLAAHVG
jgi:pimeloyl-[acyl-carrier protein] methyl ester esterase